MSFATPFRREAFALDLEMYLAGIIHLRPVVWFRRRQDRPPEVVEIRFVGARDVVRVDVDVSLKPVQFLAAIVTNVKLVEDARVAIRDLVDQ